MFIKIYNGFVILQENETSDLFTGFSGRVILISCKVF